jgi:glycosyltransferase involved in cell wall biosynthesis
MPVHNSELFLEECVSSVLDQEGVSLELICVDDCSTDSSQRVLKRLRRWDRRMKLIRQDTNLGAGAARNVGIEAARGRYVQFTDSDDMLPRDALRSLYDAVRATGAEVARGLLQRLDDGVCRPWNGEIAGVVRAEASSLPEVRGPREARVGSLLELPELWIPWFHYCCLISTDLLRRGGIRYPTPPSGENPAVLAGEDPPFLAEVLSSARRICVVPQPTYTYRLWAHRPVGFAQIRDELASAEAVKRIYGSRFAVCWASYGPYIALNLQTRMQQAALDDEQRSWCQRRLDRLLDARAVLADERAAD